MVYKQWTLKGLSPEITLQVKSRLARLLVFKKGVWNVQKSSNKWQPEIALGLAFDTELANKDAKAVTFT